MFTRRIIKKLAVALMSATIVAGTLGTGVTASANNCSDTSFSFSMKNSMKYTSARTKEDTSKLYMYCKSVSKSVATYTAHAIGTSDANAIGVDCSNGCSYVFGAGTAYYMTSVVKERGYTCARIGASPNYSYSYTASGVWSPDNYNKY